MSENLSDMRTIVGRAALRGVLHGLVVGAIATLLVSMGVPSDVQPAGVDEARPKVTSASVLIPTR